MFDSGRDRELSVGDGLADTVEALDRRHFHVEESAFTETDLTVHTWMACDDPSGIAAALGTDASVRTFSLVDERDGERLYELRIADDKLLPRDIIQRFDGIIREAYGTEEEWTIEVWFPGREDLSAVADLFEDYGIEVTDDSISELRDADTTRLDRLTDAQREAIQAAIDRGYYEVPRDVTLAELADHLGVTHQALSERLRRAQEKPAQKRLSRDPKQSPRGPVD